MSFLPIIGTLFGGSAAAGTAASGISASQALSALGTGIGAVGTVAQGVSANNAAKYEAAQEDQQAKEEVAASQRDALEKRREAALANSRAQALAAASGAGAGTDAPTIVNLMSQTAGQGDYNAQSAMYGGYQRAAGLIDSAKGRRASGRASLLGSVLGGFGMASKGMSSTFG